MKSSSLKIRICYLLSSTIYLSALTIFLFKDPISGDNESRAMINLKGYILFQNFLLLCVFRLSLMKLPWVWKNVSKFLQMLLLISCVAGLMVYIVPIYFSGREGEMKTPNGEIDLEAYDK